MRYLENRLREAFGFTGTPIRLAVQKKQQGDEEPTEAAKVRRVIDPGIGLKPGRRKAGAIREPAGGGPGPRRRSPKRG
jgi:GTP-binding protein